jgi:signal transduction histidine kinase
MSPAPALAALLHLAGFGTGVALYALLGAMTLRAGRRPRADGRAEDRIPLATAALGICWNVGALVLYPMRDLGLAPPRGGGPAWLLALGVVAFGALGFLPAVAVQAAAQPVARRARQLVTAAAYALSGAAAALQAWGALDGGALPARPALLLLTVGYAAVLAVLAARLRRQPAGRAPVAAAALAAFAVMALHLRHHASAEPVAAHLLGDQAAIPLALVILYQDYRFAFADLFLKRALTGLVLAGLALAVHLLVLVPVAVPRLAANPADPLATALGAGVLAAALVVAPRARRLVDALVDRSLLRRADYQTLRGEVAAAVAAAGTPAAVLDAVAARLAPALSAGAVTWAEQPPPAGGVALVHADARGRSATADVPTADAPGYRLHVDDLRAGRRLLSDDLALLEWAAVQAARRVDLVRVTHERCEREARELEAVRLATEAELRALRAQLNPHFLFNALTTIGYLVQAAPDRALATLHELTGLLRAVLRSPAGDLVPLGDELAIVEAYLAIERARFEERLRVTVDADDDARRVGVPPLLVQPLVENAVKHGVAPLARGGAVRVWARVEPGAPGDAAGARLRVRVSDSGAGADPAAARGRGAGVGLASVERRLERLYGGAATFAFRSRRGRGTTVELSLPVRPAAAPAAAPPAAPPAADAPRALRVVS